jgi:hypothetical protein
MGNMTTLHVARGVDLKGVPNSFKKHLIEKSVVKKCNNIITRKR